MERFVDCVERSHRSSAGSPSTFLPAPSGGESHSAAHSVLTSLLRATRVMDVCVSVFFDKIHAP